MMYSLRAVRSGRFPPEAQACVEGVPHRFGNAAPSPGVAARIAQAWWRARPELAR